MGTFTLQAEEVPEKPRTFREWLSSHLCLPNLKLGDVRGYLEEAWNAGYAQGHEDSFNELMRK